MYPQLPRSDHQDRKQQASCNNPKHDGTCKEFLSKLEKMYTSSTREKASAFDRVWFANYGLFGGSGVNYLYKRMIVLVGPGITPTGASDKKDGKEEKEGKGEKLKPGAKNEVQVGPTWPLVEGENVCEGEVLSIDPVNGWVHIRSGDLGEYRLPSGVVLGYIADEHKPYPKCLEDVQPHLLDQFVEMHESRKKDRASLFYQAP